MCDVKRVTMEADEPGVREELREEVQIGEIVGRLLAPDPLALLPGPRLQEAREDLANAREDEGVLFQGTAEPLFEVGEAEVKDVGQLSQLQLGRTIDLRVCIDDEPRQRRAR